MEFWRRWFGRGQSNAVGRVRRVIVVVLEGLDLELVDRYIEQGLLHHLALLSDIGTRVVLDGTPSNELEFLVSSAAKDRQKWLVFPAISVTSKFDLQSICDADRAQQERLITALSRRRPVVVAAVFDMPRQLQKLFGPHPKPEEQLIARDVYARMDEIVGKAFSFVDETTVLVAVVPGRECPEHGKCGSVPGRLYVSRPLQSQCEDRMSMLELVQELLGNGI